MSNTPDIVASNPLISAWFLTFSNLLYRHLQQGFWGPVFGGFSSTCWKECFYTDFGIGWYCAAQPLDCAATLSLRVMLNCGTAVILKAQIWSRRQLSISLCLIGLHWSPWKLWKASWHLDIKSSHFVFQIVRICIAQRGIFNSSQTGVLGLSYSGAMLAFSSCFVRSSSRL